MFGRPSLLTNNLQMMYWKPLSPLLYSLQLHICTYRLRNESVNTDGDDVNDNKASVLRSFFFYLVFRRRFSFFPALHVGLNHSPVYPAASWTIRFDAISRCTRAVNRTPHYTPYP